tara:strand:- start:1325 stop:1648 length:324 start_codon:yes stop_codon:yes gene_type:complete
MSLTNYKIDEIAQDFSEDAWFAFHDGEINDLSDLETFKEEWISSKCTYTNDCKQYCDDFNADIFALHDVFGRANNWNQAGYNAVFDALAESTDTVEWDEMEEVLTEA